MSTMTIGRWGKNLAVRVPHDLAKSLSLVDGERVDVEVRDGDIVIRRTQARADARAKAHAAAAAIRADRRGRTLGALSIRALIDEGRR